jgi:hypothetical protein
MEYIDKNISREWAQTLIKDFLKRRLDEDGKYPEDLYGAFMGDPSCKDLFVARLLDDNNHRCCYCMRDIQGTSLEHMIPRAVKTKSGYEKYFEKESQLDADNMMLAQEFLDKSKDVPPFPHTLAYENLIPSCIGNLPSKSAKCCNNYRKDQFVYPLVFRPEIHEEVKYYNNGNITWPEDPEETIPTLTKLGLDCLELKMIRRIWYYLSKNGLGCEEANRDKTIYDLLIEIGEPTNSEERNMQQMLRNFKKPEYWKLLEKYTYFNNTKLFG